MNGIDQEVSESYLNLKRRFTDFIQDHEPSSGSKYVDRIEALFGDEAKPGKNLRLLIDVHDLRQFDEKTHNSVLSEPYEVLRPCIDAVRDAARGISDGKLAEKHAAKIDVRSLESFQQGYQSIAQSFNVAFRVYLRFGGNQSHRSCMRYRSN
jgi:DNA replicative helicase MCM subunit Mcm2 (Cdc46/Mcm family)